MAEIESKTRYRRVVTPRQLISCMFLEFTSLSLSKIGSIINKDHATVLNSKKRVSNFIETEPEFAKMYKDLQNRVELNGIKETDFYIKKEL